MGKIICTLDKNINQCRFFDASDATCAREEPCFFGEKKENAGNNNKKYVREERWYEKYYK